MRTLFRLVLCFIALFIVIVTVTGGMFSCGKAFRFFASAMAASRHWDSSVPGIEYRDVDTGMGSGDQHLKMVRFDQARIRASVIYARDFGERAMTVRDMAERAGAIAGINGSYFDEYDRPLGYLKVQGREINDYIATAIVYSGVASFQDGRLSLVHRGSFHREQCSEALQAGPRLVGGGSATTGIERTIDYRERARRSGIALDREGRVVIYITSPLSSEMNWKELRSLLMGPEEKGGIDPRDVLNLDGGGSTQLYVHAGKIHVSEGYSKVPVAIAFFRR